jgi:hypothetical protein
MIKNLLLLSGVALSTISGSAFADTPSEWQRADANRDGAITLREATRSARSTFAALDRNRDGVLSPFELRSASYDVRSEDNNRDGRVTYNEHDTAARARFDRLDRNHDGVISNNELRGRGRYGSYR